MEYKKLIGMSPIIPNLFSSYQLFWKLVIALHRVTIYNSMIAKT